MPLNAYGWDYEITADNIELSDFCERVVIVTEGMADREDANFKVPGLDGEMSFPNKLWNSGNVVMVTFLRYSDEDGLVTHEDGAAGEVYRNLSSLKQIFSKNGLVDLRRSAPHHGEVQMLVELVQGPTEASYPAHLIWVLKAPKPFWKALTPTVISASGSHTPEGDAPVDDMVCTFPTDGKITIDDEWIEMNGAAEQAIVDCGARTVTSDDSGDGTPLDRFFFPYSDRWLRLEGGVASTVTITGGASLSYYAHWHGGGG